MTSHSFSTVKRGGYEPAEVDDYIEDLANDVGRLEEQIAISRTRIGAFEKRIKGDEDAETVVQTAFLAAAQVKGDMLEDAERRAARIIDDAKSAASRGSGSPRESDEMRQEARSILAVAKEKLIESDEEAQRRVATASEEADQILAGARRSALASVDEHASPTQRQVDEAREELRQLVGVLQSLKALVATGFSTDDESDTSLKPLLADAERLVGVVDGDQADPATA